jgi:hypothetical protein
VENTTRWVVTPGKQTNKQTNPAISYMQGFFVSVFGFRTEIQGQTAAKRGCKNTMEHDKPFLHQLFGSDFSLS